MILAIGRTAYGASDACFQMNSSHIYWQMLQQDIDKLWVPIPNQILTYAASKWHSIKHNEPFIFILYK